MNFSLPFSRRIVFGDGCSNQVGAIAKGLGGTKILCIYDKGVKDAGLVAPILETLVLTGLEPVMFEDVQVSVPYSTIKEAAALAADAGINCILAIGGGSAMDTGKAVNVALTQEGDFDKYVGTFDAFPVYGPALKPYICIPTTAGTGSEVSPVAVVYDVEAGVKKALPQEENTPTVAIVDPLLHVGMPPKLTAATGWDALAHAIEGIGGYKRNPLLTAWGLTVCDLVYKFLPRAVADGKDLEAREGMAMAATFGIIVGSGGGFHLGHAFGHSIEAVTHVPHGITCAFALPEVCEWYAEAIPAETRSMARIFGVDVNGQSNAEIGRELKQALRDFYFKLDLPHAQGVIPDASRIDHIIDLTMGEFTYMTSIRKPTRKELTGMLEAACEATN